MKRKHGKRFLSFILSFMMIVSLLYFGSISVNAEDYWPDIIVNDEEDIMYESIEDNVIEDTYESTNGHTQAEAVAWTNSQVGKQLNYDIWNVMDQPYQCVDLTCFYYEYLGQTAPLGDAKDYVNGGKFCPSGWSYQNIPQPGDVAVSTEGQWGHVAIVTEIRQNTYVVVEQNFYGPSVTSREVSYSQATYNFEVFIRPDFNVDKTSPTISNVKVSDVSTSGYTVTCDVSDNVGVTRVTFPTWTVQNGQDDLIWHEGTINNNKASVRINTSEHNGEINCKYCTHIYAYDACGNEAGVNDTQYPDLLVLIEEIKGEEMTTGYDRVLPDGDYLIASAGSTNKKNFMRLDINGTAQPATVGTNVIICENGGNDNIPSSEIWTIKYEDGFYSIKQMNTDISLEVLGASRISGANVKVNTFNSGSNQKWAISSNGKNGYRIQSKCSGFSLDVCGADVQTGTNVQVWENNNSSAQSWIFIPYKPKQSIGNGNYVFVSESDSNLVLSSYGESMNDGARLLLKPAEQGYCYFTINKLTNGYYQIEEYYYETRAIDSENGSSNIGNLITLVTKNGNISQQWAIIPYNDSYRLVARCSGMALTVTTQKVANQQYISDSNTQLWKIVPAEYTIKYDMNGGNGTIPSQLKYYGNAIKISSTIPTMEGVEFLGWSLNKNATSAEYKPGDDFTLNQNATLYAIYDNALKGKVTINGTKKYGQTLTAKVSGSNAFNFTYQWKRGNSNISGATSSSYKLVKDDIGKKITCEVKDADGFYTGTIKSSATSAIEKADGPAAPTGLKGVAATKKGAADGKITGVKTTMEYSTKSDFSSNVKACTSTTITGLKAGTYYVRIKETDTTKAGSAATVKVPDGVQEITGTVTISGTKQFGKTLTAKVTDSNASSFKYQWMRGSTNISGANASTYKLVKADIGQKISCVVTDADGKFSGSIKSAATGAIAKADGPAAPTGLKGVAATKKGAADGKITGVKTTMEYSTKSDFSSNVKACTSTTITGLKAGTYYVRIKETDTTKAGNAATVKVNDGPNNDVTVIFIDVEAGAWYVNAIQFVYDRGIMSGTGTGDTFEPNGTLTRGQFVTVLYSMEGKPQVAYRPVFTDVAESAYYARPAIWALDTGITAGTGNGKFSPNANITREQLAIMLYKYAEHKDYDLTIKGNALNGFTDKNKVSSYAQEAMKWAVTQGIISGKGDKLDPQGKATRAECAAMIMRLLQKNE